MKLEAALKLIEQYRETIAKLSGQIPEPKPETNAAYVSPEQKQKELEKRHRDSCPDGANCSCFDADRGIPRSHRKRKTFIDQ